MSLGMLIDAGHQILVEELRGVSGMSLFEAEQQIDEMFLPEQVRRDLEAKRAKEAEIAAIREQVRQQQAFFARAGMGGVFALPPVTRKQTAA
jgi:hypothetical protein